MADDRPELNEAAAEWDGEEADDRFGWAPEPDRSILRRALPIITPEWEAANIDWIRAKVQEALDNPEPAVPIEEAFARVRAKLQAKYGSPDDGA